jgi:hypothetical protein
MPFLTIGIDTEGDNQWSVASRLDPTYENIYALPGLHALFQRCSVRPSYLVTYPVAIDPRSRETLARLVDHGDCELGAHHHAWETPPCDPSDVRGLPYALELPIDRFEQQITSLTAAIANVSGSSPMAYRSGRFGFDATHTAVLERAGYRIDTSVQPLFYEVHKGGPDFVEAPLRPYFLSYDSAVRPGSSSVLEVPVSAALNRSLPMWAIRLYGRLPAPYHSKRLLRLARIVKTWWLRPSFSSLEEMKCLAGRMVRKGEPVLNVIFHSSEAIAGASPYNRTESEVNAFLDRLEGLLRYAIDDLGATPVTFRELHRAWTRDGR